MLHWVKVFSLNLMFFFTIQVSLFAKINKTILIPQYFAQSTLLKRVKLVSLYNITKINPVMQQDSLLYLIKEIVSEVKAEKLT